MGEETSFLERVISHYTPTASDRDYSDAMWPRMAGYAERIVSLMEAKPPAKVLDLACGCGGATTAIALRGFDVTAIDCTPAALEIARRMSKQKGAPVEWLCQDMRTIRYEREFDYVCLRDVVFGIFEREGEDLDLIRRIALALKAGGRCLFEIYNKEFALRHGVEGVLFYDESSGRFVSKDAERMRLSMRLYSHDEWRRMLPTSGLAIVKMDGWKWQADPPPPPWRANLIVAQKEPG
jgi:2-polyprenyl-3-methyl-5-hydroxy-6-metoxy-1,4-benzoquinol methylase